MRDEMQIRKKDEVSIIMRGEEIRIRKTENFCIACCETENLIKYQNKYICQDCIANIKKLQLRNKFTKPHFIIKTITAESVTI